MYLFFDYFIGQFCVEMEVKLYEQFVGNDIIVVGVCLDIGYLYIGGWEKVIVLILFDSDQFIKKRCSVMNRVICQMWIGDVFLNVMNSEVIGERIVMFVFDDIVYNFGIGGFVDQIVIQLFVMGYQCFNYFYGVIFCVGFFIRGN